MAFKKLMNGISFGLELMTYELTECIRIATHQPETITYEK